jgi:hypothetical protein
MRKLLTILLLFVSLGVLAQKRDTTSLAWCVREFNKALVNRDTVELNWLLRDDIHYIHSNGWVQLKRDIINDLYNGKLTYKNIDVTSRGVKLNGPMGAVEMKADVDVLLDGKTVHLNLKINQLWTWKNDRWELFSRISEKV